MPEEEQGEETTTAHVKEFHAALKLFEARCLVRGAYMPEIATRLRIWADIYADKYPDDANEGRRS